MDGDIAQNFERLLTSWEAFDPRADRAERARLLTNIREQLEELRSSNEAFGQSASGRSAASAEGAAEAAAIRSREAASVEMLRPRILSLQRYLTDTAWSDDREARKLLQDAINVFVAYIGGYQDIRDHLLREQTDQGPTSYEILRARPVKGKVDHAALSREFMARFPKIRAALAK